MVKVAEEQDQEFCNRFEEIKKQLLTAYFEVIQGHFFREVTYSILRRCDDGKKDQVCCLKDGTDGVVSTASTTTSNPLSTLYCYDISGSNDRGWQKRPPDHDVLKQRMLKPFSNQTINSTT